MATLQFDPDAALNFVLWGDPQLSRLHPQREANLSAACRTVGEAAGRADALVIAGDVTEFGRQTEYDAVSRCLAPAADKTDHIFCIPGNHDIRMRPFAAQCRRFSAFMGSVKNGVATPPDRYWFSWKIKGYTLIFLGADRAAFEGSYLSREQLRWLSDELSAAEADGRPVFVFNHQPLKRTNGLPVTWGGFGTWRGSVGDQNDALRAIFKKHGEIVYITGHLHHGICRYHLENSGKLHMLTLPSVGCPNNGENPAETQGYLMRVYPDRIEGEGVLFATGEALDPAVANARFTIPLEK